VVILFVVIAAAELILAQPSPTADADADAPPRELPLRPFRGLATAPVQIGDSKPLNFVIDSGSEHTALNDAELVEQLNLHTRYGGSGRGMGGAKLEVLIAPDVAIRSAASELFRTDLVIHHLSSLKDHEMGRHFHGLLGSDLFERYVVDMDPAGRTVRLHEPDRWSYGGSGHIIPLIMESRRPFVKARVITESGKSAKVRLMVDTGSEYHLALVLGSHRNLDVPEHHAEVTALGLGGEVTVLISAVNGFEAGSLALGRTPAAFFHPGSMPSARKISNFDGLIGNGILAQYRTILDYHKKVLILESL
jgi:hypothetical protein